MCMQVWVRVFVNACTYRCVGVHAYVCTSMYVCMYVCV